MILTLIGMFLAGILSCIVALVAIARKSGRTGPNSRVPMRESIVAVKNKET